VRPPDGALQAGGDSASLRLFFPEEGTPLAAPGDRNDFLSETWAHRVTVAVLPVLRLEPEFLLLRARLAGEVMQKFVNYQMPLITLGDTSDAAAQSSALRETLR
jgi:hypothetical protein